MFVSTTSGSVVTGSRVAGNYLSLLLYLCLQYVSFCLSSDVIDYVAPTGYAKSMIFDTIVISLEKIYSKYTKQK